MPKKLSEFRTVVIGWIMPVEERQAIEDLLRTLGYRVDGGGTNLEHKTSEIYVLPKARSHRRKATTPKAPEVTS
jgi:hypothetical protein